MRLQTGSVRGVIHATQPLVRSDPGTQPLLVRVASLDLSSLSTLGATEPRTPFWGFLSLSVTPETWETR